MNLHTQFILEESLVYFIPVKQIDKLRQRDQSMNQWHI